ncbi:MAG: hypothetical protein V5A27_13445 [Halapricum sp.]
MPVDVVEGEQRPVPTGSRGRRQSEGSKDELGESFSVLANAVSEGSRDERSEALGEQREP